MGAALAAALLAGGCSAGEDTPGAAGPPNLLLLSIDTLGAGHLGCYGYERDTSPHIDQLAAAGVLFEHAVAPASWTMPSHASLLTGVYARRHRVNHFGGDLPDNLGTLASTLSESGYATAAVVHFAALEGLLRDFDSRWTVKPDEGSSEDVFALGEQWLAEAPSPFFLFMHSYDPHLPYRPAPEFRVLFEEPYSGIATGGTLQVQKFNRGRLRLGLDDARHLRNLYDAEVRQQDARLGELLRRLESAGRLDDTVVALVSDHGEEFFEHGGLGHGRTLHQELTRVPLILAGPGLPRGRRVQAPVSLIDLAPTLLALAGAPPLEKAEGVDLSGSWREPGAPLPDRAIHSATNTWVGNENLHFKRSLRQGPYALHYDSDGATWALFDLAADPAETQDLAAREPQLMARLRALLTPRIPRARPAPAPPVPDELIEELRALGYLDPEDGSPSSGPP